MVQTSICIRGSRCNTSTAFGICRARERRERTAQVATLVYHPLHLHAWSRLLRRNKHRTAPRKQVVTFENVYMQKRITSCDAYKDIYFTVNMHRMIYSLHLMFRIYQTSNMLGNELRLVSVVSEYAARRKDHHSIHQQNVCAPKTDLAPKETTQRSTPRTSLELETLDQSQRRNFISSDFSPNSNLLLLSLPETQSLRSGAR